jgi:hypothetical protein
MCTAITSIDMAVVEMAVVGRVAVGRPVVGRVAVTVDAELDADRVAGSPDAPQPERFENQNGAGLLQQPQRTHANRCYLGSRLL